MITLFGDFCCWRFAWDGRWLGKQDHRRWRYHRRHLDYQSPYFQLKFIWIMEDLVIEEILCSHFVKKAFVPLCIPAISPFMTHHNISFRFRVTARRLKNLRFSLIPFATRNFFWRPVARSFSMPPTFHIAHLNCYPPNFPWVDIVPLICHTAPPKVRIPNFLAAYAGPFRGYFLDAIKFPGQTIHFRLLHAACYTYSESYDT